MLNARSRRFAWRGQNKWRGDDVCQPSPQRMVRRTFHGHGASRADIGGKKCLRAKAFAREMQGDCPCQTCIERQQRYVQPRLTRPVVQEERSHQRDGLTQG